MNKVLILVDCQKDFMDKNGALYVPDAEYIKKNILKLVNSAVYDMVLVTKDSHESEFYHETDESKMFPPHCLIGSEGHELFDGLEDALSKKNNVVTFQKNFFDVWKEDAFNEYVDKEMSTDDELTIAGVATNYCVFYNVAGFVEKGFNNIVIPDDCIKEIPDKTFEKATTKFKEWGIKC